MNGEFWDSKKNNRIELAGSVHATLVRQPLAHRVPKSIADFEVVACGFRYLCVGSSDLACIQKGSFQPFHMLPNSLLVEGSVSSAQYMV